MNAAELKTLIVKADRQALCEALAPLDENQRADLFADAVRIYRIVDAGSFLGADDTADIGLEDEDWFDAGFLARLRKASYADWRVPRMTAGLMMLAVCDQKGIRSPYDLGIQGWLRGDLKDMPQRVLQILDDRRPPWLAEFVKRDVKDEFPIITWSIERGLMRSGALPPDDSDEFIQRMAGEQTIDSSRAVEITTDNLAVVYSSLDEYALSDPEIIETLVWRLFEVDTSAFRWFETLKRLAKKGQLDRDRLLSASVQGMSLPFRPSVVGGFAKFHEGLEPTLGERERLTGDYLAALNSEHSAVVGAALAALEKLAKVKKLPAELFLNQCTAALRIAKKAQPVKAMKLIRTLLKQEPDASSRATEVLAIAVGHERPDVQESAIGHLDALREHLTDSARELVAGLSLSVASAVRPKLNQLISPASDGPTKPTAGKSGAKTSPATRKKSTTSKGSDNDSPQAAAPVTAIDANLAKRVKGISPEIRKATGIDDAMAAVDSETDPFIVVIDPGTVPRRDPDTRISPIQSIDELIDTVASVIEKVDDAMEVERILDGISRFHAERPDDFDKRTGPLKKRIEKLNEPYTRSVIDLGAQIGFSQLLATWLEMTPIHRELGEWDDINGLMFRLRAAEVVGRIECRKPAACRLALPTHQHGWLDPEQLVQRLQTDYLSPRKITDDIDLAQAMLRLTPDGRQAALQKLSHIGTDNHSMEHYGGGNALRFALGGDAVIKSAYGYRSEQRKNTAAVHARAAIEDHQTFVPPVPVATAYSAEDYSFKIDGPFTEDLSLPAHLCVIAHSLYNTGSPGFNLTDWPAQLEAMIWPINPQPMLMLGWLDRLFDADMTWSKEAARIAVFASSLESKDFRLRATDALIDSIAQVRVHPELVGDQMLLLRESLTLKRTAEVLAGVGRVSELHQWSVFRVLDRFIAGLTEVPKDLHFALTPMLEAGLQSGSGLSDPARIVLQTVKGSSKTAKLAKQLLDVQADPTKQTAVRLQAAIAAVERAERWQAITS